MPNLINYLRLDIEFCSTKIEATEKSDSYYHNDVLPVIERVCRKFGGVSVFVGGSLEIDLGEVSEVNLAYSLENALETALIKLQNSSKAEQQGIKHSQNATDIAQEEVFNEIEFFFNYLQLPRLHWTSESGSSFNFSSVLEIALQEIAQSNTLLQRLISILAKHITILQRFVYLSANDNETYKIVKQIIKILSPDTYQQFEIAHTLLNDKVFTQNSEVKKQVYLFWLQGLLFGSDIVYNNGLLSQFLQYTKGKYIFNLNRILSKNLAFSEIDVFTKLISPVYSRLIEENALNTSDIHCAYPSIENIELLFDDYSLSKTNISSNEKGKIVKDVNRNQQHREQISIDKEIEPLNRKKDEDKLNEKFEHTTKYMELQTNRQTSKSIGSGTDKLFNKEIHFVKDYTSPTQSIEKMFFNENKRIPVNNSGLVILQPFLVTLFDKLELLDIRRTFKSIESQIKAIHVLQAITGNTYEHFEHLIYLNKLICGMDIHFPIDKEYNMSDSEKTEIQNLLKSVIRHWKIISNTSVAGFQNSFLSRKGYLEKSSNDWILRVETKAIDVLLEDLPWSINIVSFPWNGYIIYVDWIYNSK